MGVRISMVLLQKEQIQGGLRRGDIHNREQLHPRRLPMSCWMNPTAKITIPYRASRVSTQTVSLPGGISTPCSICSVSRAALGANEVNAPATFRDRPTILKARAKPIAGPVTNTKATMANDMRNTSPTAPISQVYGQRPRGVGARALGVVGILLGLC